MKLGDFVDSMFGNPLIGGAIGSKQYGKLEEKTGINPFDPMNILPRTLEGYDHGSGPMTAAIEKIDPTELQRMQAMALRRG